MPGLSPVSEYDLLFQFLYFDLQRFIDELLVFLARAGQQERVVTVALPYPRG